MLTSMTTMRTRTTTTFIILQIPSCLFFIINLCFRLHPRKVYRIIHHVLSTEHRKPGTHSNNLIEYTELIFARVHSIKLHKCDMLVNIHLDDILKCSKVLILKSFFWCSNSKRFIHFILFAVARHFHSKLNKWFENYVND